MSQNNNNVPTYAISTKLMDEVVGQLVKLPFNEVAHIIDALGQELESQVEPEVEIITK